MGAVLIELAHDFRQLEALVGISTSKLAPTPESRTAPLRVRPWPAGPRSGT
jgi:hypothetical protein